MKSFNSPILPEKSYSQFKNQKIQENKKNGLLWDSNSQSLDYEAEALPLYQLDMLYLFCYM